MKLQICVLVIFVCLLPLHQAARILAIIPFSVDSHFPIFESLLKDLAKRGHQVVVVSHYPQKYPVENYTDISLIGSLPTTRDNINFDMLEQMNSGLFATHFFKFATSSCEAVYKHPNVKKIIETDEKFDLVINEIWGNDCFLGIASKFKVPHIGIITSIAYPWSNARIANPDNPSYIPNFFVPYSDSMSFTERLINFVYVEGTKWLHYYLSEAPTYRISRQYYGEDLPALSEIAGTTSLILVNSYFSLHQPRPVVPSFVEIAGLHIREARDLPQDIQKYIDESEHGVIYFSFGTMILPDTMPKERLQVFLEVFSRLPQRVLWKCNSDTMPQLPANVRCYSWLPQRDILEHSNVRVFITHGGMMGTQEAVHTGVPMLGFPLFADQILNIQNYVTKKVAIKLDFNTFTKKTLLDSLHALTSDPSYRENSQRLSKLFRDRPLSPLDTAIFWTEYVIRHKGAPHLRSAAVDLYWYQLLLLDVIAVPLVLLFAICYTVYVMVKKCISRSFTKRNTSIKKGSRKKKTQ